MKKKKTLKNGTVVLDKEASLLCNKSIVKLLSHKYLVLKYLKSKDL